MARVGLSALLICALSGCALAPYSANADACPASRYTGGYSAGYTDGRAEGKARALKELRAAPEFSVSSLALDGFDNRDPWLPENQLVIDGITYKRAVRQGNKTRRACAVRLHEAQKSIYQMLERLREGQ